MEQSATFNHSLQVVNWTTTDGVKEIQRLMPGGPDAVLECVGFRCVF
jgi:hypothetical protein